MLQVFALDIHKTTNKELYGVDLVLRVIRVPNDPVTLKLGRNESVNADDNEFNSAAISLLWHPPAMLCGVQINVAGIQRRQKT